MKIRNTDDDDSVTLQMTPMIDIVFQLLAFFIITFKVVTLEGDFNIKMPLASQDQVVDIENFETPITIELFADSDGNIDDIVVNERNRFGRDYAALSAFMIDLVADPNMAEFSGEPEVEFICANHLRYEEAIHAVTAVTGYRDGDDIVTLVEKIRFKDSDGPGAQ